MKFWEFSATSMPLKFSLYVQKIALWQDASAKICFLPRWKRLGQENTNCMKTQEYCILKNDTHTQEKDLETETWKTGWRIRRWRRRRSWRRRRGRRRRGKRSKRCGCFQSFSGVYSPRVHWWPSAPAHDVSRAFYCNLVRVEICGHVHLVGTGRHHQTALQADMISQ